MYGRMEEFTNTENVDMRCMYRAANGNSRKARRRTVFLQRQLPNPKTFARWHRQRVKWDHFLFSGWKQVLQGRPKWLLWKRDYLIWWEIPSTSIRAHINSHSTYPHAHQRCFSINGWVGIVKNLLTKSYLQQVLPDLLENVPTDIRWRMWFHHDGAPPYY